MREEAASWYATGPMSPDTFVTYLPGRSLPVGMHCDRWQICYCDQGRQQQAGNEVAQGITAARANHIFHPGKT